MKDALLRTAHQLRLSGLHCRYCSLLVACADRLFNLAESAAHAACAVLVILRGGPKRALPSLPILYWPFNFPDHLKWGQTNRNNIKAIGGLPIAQQFQSIELGGL